MTLYFFAWIASLLFGLEGIVAKLVNRHSIQNPWLLNFLWMLFVLIFTVPIALFCGATLPISFSFILGGSIFFALASVLNTIAISKLDVSVLVSLFSFRTAMAVIVGSFFLHEVLTAHQYFIILLIFVFGIFVTIDERFSFKSFFTWNILIALVYMLSLVFSAMFFKLSVAINGFWNTALWIPLVGQFWLLFTIPFFKNIIVKVEFRQYLAIIAIAVIGVLGTLSANAAYSKNVSLASVIISLPLSMIIAFLFSIFAPELLENHSLKVYMVRFTAAIIMVIAALNL
jgi:drug/metabolite transporter (DMT)-like permease